MSCQGKLGYFGYIHNIKILIGRKVTMASPFQQRTENLPLLPWLAVFIFQISHSLLTNSDPPNPNKK